MSEEGSMAYTPGLKRREYAVIHKTRKLPLKGKVFAQKGDKVQYDTIIANTSIPGRTNSLPVAALLGVELTSHSASGAQIVDDIEKYLLKKKGEQVVENEIIAKRRAFFGLINKECSSPCDGFIEYVSQLSGEVMIRELPIPLNLNAYIPGSVIEVIPEEGVVIETFGAFIQGIFGIGGEAHGELRILAESPDQTITADQITTECSGKILVCECLIQREAINKAVDVKVSGIITGGIEIQDLSDFLGYTIGVAITGHEEKGITLIITEGFGNMHMAEKTFKLLKKHEGREAYINGATQIRAGVIRPEVIIPTEFDQSKSSEDKISLVGMRPGLEVRVIRDPYFGALGRIVSLPIDLQRLESHSFVRVLEVELNDGRKITVPRANVELIEE